MEIIKNIRYGKLTDNTCVICLEDIREKKIKNLCCNHKLHKKCFKLFINSPSCNKQCPTCRADISGDIPIPQPQESIRRIASFMELLREPMPTIQHKCSNCNKNVNVSEESCQAIKSPCGCYFHFDCIKNIDIIQCNKCNITIERKMMNSISYLYFETGYLTWIGPILICKQRGCHSRCNPKRFGYCAEHNKSLASNKAVILTLQYFVKFVKLQNNKQEYFNKVLNFMYVNYEHVDEWLMDFNEIHRRIVSEI